jgi:hypothetical protein
MGLIGADVQMEKEFKRLFEPQREEAATEASSLQTFSGLAQERSRIAQKLRLRQVAQTWSSDATFEETDLQELQDAGLVQFWFGSLNVSRKEKFVQTAFHESKSPFWKRRAEMLVGFRKLVYQNYRTDLYQLPEIDRFMALFFNEGISEGQSIQALLTSLRLAQERGQIMQSRLEGVLSGTQKLELTSTPAQSHVIAFWDKLTEEHQKTKSKTVDNRSELGMFLYFVEHGVYFHVQNYVLKHPSLQELFDHLIGVREDLLIKSIWDKLELYFVRHRLAHQLRTNQLKSLVGSLIKRYRSDQRALVAIQTHISSLMELGVPNFITRKWYTHFLELIREPSIDQERLESFYLDLQSASSTSDPDTHNQLSKVFDKLAKALTLSKDLGDLSLVQLETSGTFYLDNERIQTEEIHHAIHSGYLESYLLTLESDQLKAVLLDVNEEELQARLREVGPSKTLAFQILKRLNPGLALQVTAIVEAFGHIFEIGETQWKEELTQNFSRELVKAFRDNGGDLLTAEVDVFLKTSMRALLSGNAGKSLPKIEFKKTGTSDFSIKGKARIQALEFLKDKVIKEPFIHEALVQMLPEWNALNVLVQKEGAADDSGAIKLFEKEEGLAVFLESITNDLRFKWAVNYPSLPSFIGAFKAAFSVGYGSASLLA